MGLIRDLLGSASRVDCDAYAAADTSAKTSPPGWVSPTTVKTARRSRW